jgi:DNA-binding MarR family transcriptional regulator
LQVISPLHKGIRQLQHCLGERSRELGVRGADAHLLSYVSMYGPCPLTELRRVFGHRPSTLTSLLDRLEGNGWIERRADPRDRRGVRVQATTEGRSLGRRARGLAETLEAEIRARVRPADVEGFRRVLAALGEVSGFEPRQSDD